MIMGLINYTEVVPGGTSNEEGNLLIEQEIEEFLRYAALTVRCSLMILACSLCCLCHIFP
jgi:hypothetical protein